MSFVRRHGLWSDAQHAAAREMADRIRADGVEVVRFVFADQHGLTRGKTLVAAEALRVLEDGIAVGSAAGIMLATAHAHAPRRCRSAWTQ